MAERKEPQQQPPPTSRQEAGAAAVRWFGEPLQLHGHTTSVQYACFSPDSRHVATASLDSVRIHDVRSGRELAVLRDHEGVINSCEYCPDGLLLATGSDDQSIGLFDVSALAAAAAAPAVAAAQAA